MCSLDTYPQHYLVSYYHSVFTTVTYLIALCGHLWNGHKACFFLFFFSKYAAMQLLAALCFGVNEGGYERWSACPAQEWAGVYGSSGHVWSSAFLWRATNLDYSTIIYLERFEYLCAVVEWTLANGLLATYQIHRKIWSSIAIQDVLWFDAFLFNSYKLRTMPGMKPRKKVSYMGKHTSYKIEHTNSLLFTWVFIHLYNWDCD